MEDREVFEKAAAIGMTKDQYPIIFGRLENWPLIRMLDLANRFGSRVAGCESAMPELRDEAPH